MKFEVVSLKWERRHGLGVSTFTLHLINFHLAATINRNFGELGA